MHQLELHLGDGPLHLEQRRPMRLVKEPAPHREQRREATPQQLRFGEPEPIADRCIRSQDRAIVRGREQTTRGAFVGLREVVRDVATELTHVDTNSRMAWMMASGALRGGQCPMLRTTRSVPFGSLRARYSATSVGAIMSSDDCKSRHRVANRARSSRWSLVKVTWAKCRAISGSVRQKLLVSSSPNSGRS